MIILTHLMFHCTEINSRMGLQHTRNPSINPGGVENRNRYRVCTLGLASLEIINRAIDYGQQP